MWTLGLVMWLYARCTFLINCGVPMLVTTIDDRLPQLTGDVTTLSASRPMYSCDCPKSCPRRPSDIDARVPVELADVVYADTKSKTGMLVRVHRAGTPAEIPENNYGGVMLRCECEACP